MGNNGSSGRDQQQGSCIRSSGLSEANRGWSQSFPRELARHRSQPAAARKVLPEPPNQRLRATDNGCIIHNGGTISGRKAPTFPSSQDSEKVNFIWLKDSFACLPILKRDNTKLNTKVKTKISLNKL